MPKGLIGFQKGNTLGIKNKGNKCPYARNNPQVWKKGHIPWNKKLTKETDERIRKVSLCAKGRKGRTAWNKNIPMSDSAKLKSSISHKGKPSGNKGRHYNHKEETKQKIREWQINHPNKSFKDTSIELKVEEELIRRNINYQKQVPLCKAVKVDFYLPEYRIIIECDGCFWHGCSIHRSKYHQDNKEIDRKRDAILTFNGFNVYRFWEHEIEESVEKCINKIFN